MALNTFRSRGESEEFFYINNFVAFPLKEREAVLEKVIRVEKKSFPSSEAFDFTSELKKKNTTMIVAMNKDSKEPIGYLVYLRIRRLALLHKICVVERERGKGIGRCLIQSLRALAEKGGCEYIHLWVDEARKPAKALYESCGFRQIAECPDYYSAGRTGLKMQLAIEK